VSSNITKSVSHGIELANQALDKEIEIEIDVDKVVNATKNIATKTIEHSKVNVVLYKSRNRNFCGKLNFWSKIEILQKVEIVVGNPIFIQNQNSCRKSKFLWKIEILVENQIFCQISKLL